MGVYLGDWQLGDPEIGSPAAVTTVGTQAASVGTPSDPEEEARKQEFEDTLRKERERIMALHEKDEERRHRDRR